MAKPTARSRAPIWTRPAPGTRQPKLTRDQIALAALAIADAEGFSEVSMRRVATELDVGTMTLYYYVKTKDDLIALMDDAIGGEILVPADQLPRGWRAGLTAIARRARDVFARHPWALHGLQGVRIGPNGMRHIEQSLAVVADAPLEIQGKLHLLSIVDDYVFGSVLRAAELDAHPLDHKVMQVIADFFDAQLDTGEFPHIEALVGSDDMATAFSRFAHWMVEDSRFEVGLTALLDGMERRMATHARAPSSGASGRQVAPGASPSALAASRSERRLARPAAQHRRSPVAVPGAPRPVRPARPPRPPRTPRPERLERPARTPRPRRPRTRR